MRYLEYERASWIPCFLTTFQGKKHICFTRPSKNNDIICLQEIHGKLEFLQASYSGIGPSIPAIRYVHTESYERRRIGCLCIHKNLLHEGAIVTHVVSCQGRDHIVIIQSGDRYLVVVNVHFEPDLTLRNLRERLRLITPHWVHYPEALGVMIGDFNICEPEEGRFNTWNQTFTDGDAGKAAFFRSLFSLMSSKSLSLILQGKIQQPMVQHSLCPGLTGHFINLPVAEARDFHDYSHVFDNLGNGPFRATIQLYVSSFRNRQLGATRANVSRV